MLEIKTQAIKTSDVIFFIVKFLLSKMRLSHGCASVVIIAYMRRIVNIVTHETFLTNGVDKEWKINRRFFSCGY